MHDLTQHLAAVQPLLDRYGYVAVFVAVFVEGFGIPAPGQTLLVAAALLAGRGDLSLGVLLATAIVASASGTLVGFAIGRIGGRRALERIASRERLAKIEALFERRGGVVVGGGRFVDGLRQLAGIVAGSLDMSFTTFFAWNLAGATLWAGSWGAGAFFFERHATELSALLHHYRTLAIALAAIGLALGVLWLSRGGRRAGGATPARAD